jgi:hypothetical protein
MSKEPLNNPKPYAAARLVIRRLISASVGFVVAIYSLLLELFASTEIRHDEERRLHDSDLSGELNHRTGRLDAGADPYGWYDED